MGNDELKSVCEERLHQIEDMRKKLNGFDKKMLLLKIQQTTSEIEHLKDMVEEKQKDIDAYMEILNEMKKF